MFDIYLSSKKVLITLSNKKALVARTGVSRLNIYSVFILATIIIKKFVKTENSFLVILNMNLCNGFFFIIITCNSIHILLQIFSIFF